MISQLYANSMCHTAVLRNEIEGEGGTDTTVTAVKEERAGKEEKGNRRRVNTLVFMSFWSVSERELVSFLDSEFG